MSNVMPDGRLHEDHAVWGDLTRDSVLSRGCAVDFPDLSASDDQVFVDWEGDIRLMLGSLTAGEKLQLHFYTSSTGFSGPLDRFRGETRAHSRVEISSRVRDELVFRYRDRMARQTLIQTNARLYLSSSIPRLAMSDGRKVRGFDEVFKVLRRSFEQRQQFFDVLLRGYGGSVRPLDNFGQYRELLEFWSPGQAKVGHPKADEIDWLRTVSDLCQFSGLSPRCKPERGFFLDGFYFGVLVWKTMPRSTWAKTMDPFLALTIPNIRVVLNMEPLSIESEMGYEEERFGKLVSNIDPKSPSLQSEVGLEKHRERMRRLMSNQVLPFRAQVIVIAHDRTRDGLDRKLEAVRAAIGKSGAEAYQPAVPTSDLAFFNAATPGYGPWVRYRDYWHKIDDVNLSNLWPARSTPRGDLDTADWIADNDVNGLMGGKLFAGAQGLHMAVLGSTGAGKSVLVQTVVLQTAILFKLIVVIDNELSWASTCRKLDPTCRPIIVRSNGGQTFNLFDTRGLPLSPEHLTSATALCHLLVGRCADEDKDKLRAALLAQTINEVYGAAYRAWRQADPVRHCELCRQTAELLKFQAKHMDEADGFVDAFLAARAARQRDPQALLEFEEMTDEEALELDRNPETEHYVRNLAFAFWRPEMFPTLFDLQDELHSSAQQRGPHQELYATLASLLRPWLRDGRYGPIVDGASNVDLGSAQMSENDPLRVVHFDLGKIGEAEAELRAVVGFLITSQVRSHIQGMPRRLRKQVIIEEMKSFLRIPNGDEIVIDFYERFRKYSAQVISVFQQYGTMLESHPGVVKAIRGNSDALMLLRNSDRNELDLLSSFVHLPEVIKDRIRSFPKPETMRGQPDAYAGFVYAQFSNKEPRFTVGRNVVSQEVEQLTSSSGDVFDRKLEQLKQEIKKAAA